MSRNNNGFTIIEILVIVIIVFVLAAVVFPRYVDFENQTRMVAMKENMKAVQTAVEAYAAKNNGDYPLQPDDAGLRSYFPKGNYPENPFSHKAEAPALGTVADVQQTRQSLPVDLGGSRLAGKIFYNTVTPVGKDKPIGYAIEGADGNGVAITDTSPNMAYVLSNL